MPKIVKLRNKRQNVSHQSPKIYFRPSLSSETPSVSCSAITSSKIDGEIAEVGVNIILKSIVLGCRIKSSASPKIGLSGIGISGVSSNGDDTGGVAVGLVTEEMVDNLGVVEGWIVIGILNPNPVFDERGEGVTDGSRGDGVLGGTGIAKEVVFALLSASATFSAVRVGTAGIGLGGVVCLNVIILGCARTATGTGAAAMIAVERYAVVAMEARVIVVAVESRLVYRVSLLELYMVSRSL
jgi:hypothetical protein